MPIYVYLAALAIMGAIIVLWWAFSGPTVGSTVRENLGPAATSTDYRSIDLARSTRERLFRPSWTAIGSRARRLTTGGLADHLGHQVNLAGLSEKWPIERLLAVKLGLLGVTIVVELSYFSQNGLTRTRRRLRADGPLRGVRPPGRHAGAERPVSGRAASSGSCPT